MRQIGFDYLPLMLAAALSASLPSHAQAAAGRLVFKTGEVWIQSADGAQRAAGYGASIDTGDTVVTGSGRAQMRFTDGGHVGLIPNSRFRVDEYHYAGEADGSEKGLFSLLKGGLRAITGAIGRRHKSAYKVNAVLATIGIRGTSYQARLCEGDCANPDGLYVQGGTGTIYVANAAGSIDLGGGQRGFVLSINTEPEETAAEPEVQGPEPEAESELESAAVEPAEAGEFELGEVSLQGQAAVTRIFNVPAGGHAGFAGASNNLFQSAFSSPTHAFDPGTDNPLLGGADGGGGAFTLGPGESGFLGFDAAGGLVTFGGAAPGGYGFFTADNVLNVHYDGVLYWGRWANATLHLEGSSTAEGFGSADLQLSGNTSVHYVLSTAATNIPTVGSAVYSFTGGTPSTGNDGTLGTGAVSGSLGVNFGTLAVGLSNVVIQHNGTFTLNGAVTDPFTGPAVLDEAGFRGTVGCTGACTGADIGGFLAGQGPSAPSHAGVAYQVNHTTPGADVLGIAGFQCTSGC